MPYKKLLNNLIENSGMTAKEIAEKCQEQGASITPSYLSLLRKEDSDRTASDEVSKALARVLGADENLLVLERVIDEAPEPLIKALQNMSINATRAVATQLGAPITDDMQKQIEESVKQLPLAELVLQIAKTDTTSDISKTVNTTFDDAQEGVVNVHISGFTEFAVNNNSMYPTIKKDDRIKLSASEKFENGDIIAFVKKGKEGIECRQLQEVGDTVLLVAFNSEYPPIIFNKEEITVLGKVVAVMTLL